MNALNITNEQDLKSEILRLRALDKEQEQELAARFRSPTAVFATARTLFPKPPHPAGNSGHTDYAQLAARFLLPLTLNKTVFRHSNFLVKMLAGFASQKAAGLVTEQRAESAWEGARSFFGRLFQKKKSTTNIESTKTYEKPI